MARIIRRIMNFIFTCIIILLAIYYGLRLVGRVEIYNVKTGSMEDNIHPGDYILIVTKDQYHIGDIITFRRNGYYITHRIIERKDGKFVTKGDANNFHDEAVDTNDIVGKVILIGGVLNTIINFKYIIVGFMLSVYLFTCYFDRTLMNDKKEDKSEEENESKEDSDDDKHDVEDKKEEKQDREKEKDKKEDKNNKEDKKEKVKEEKKEKKSDNSEEVKAIDKVVKDAIISDDKKEKEDK